MLLRADPMCRMLKPLSTSVLSRFVCAIDSFLFLSRFCRIVFKIDLESLEFEPMRVGWMDDNFVVIVIIFSDNVDPSL